MLLQHLRIGACLQANAFASGIVAGSGCSCSDELIIDLTVEAEEAIVEASATAFNETCISVFTCSLPCYACIAESSDTRCSIANISFWQSNGMGACYWLATQLGNCKYLMKVGHCFCSATVFRMQIYHGTIL